MSMSRLMEYLKGETDILCFAPDREDCENTYNCINCSNGDERIQTRYIHDDSDVYYDPYPLSQTNNYTGDNIAPLLIPVSSSSLNTSTANTPEHERAFSTPTSSTPHFYVKGFDNLHLTPDQVKQSLTRNNVDSMREKSWTLPEDILDFAAAGFTPEQQIALKRQIKLQRLLREINSDARE